MANGERCVRCRLQETDHDLGVEGQCGVFDSEFRHLEGCSVLGCDGDCKKTIAEDAWQLAVAQNAKRVFVYIGEGKMPQLLIVDLD